MSVSRRARREAARREAKTALPSGAAAGQVDPRIALHWSRLRRRLRLVLLISTLAALVPLRLFRDPLALWLEQYGWGARLALVALLLSPALLTWMIGLGQLRDLQQQTSASAK